MRRGVGLGGRSATVDFDKGRCAVGAGCAGSFGSPVRPSTIVFSAALCSTFFFFVGDADEAVVLFLWFCPFGDHRRSVPGASTPLSHPPQRGTISR